MDKKLNKNELKFLRKLGISADENSSIAEIQSLFKRDENQNVPIGIETENIQKLTADTNRSFVPNPVEISTILANLEKNQNVPIENEAENVQKSSDTNRVPSPIKISAIEGNSDENQNIPITRSEAENVQKSSVEKEKSIPRSAAALAITTSSDEIQNVPIVTSETENVIPSSDEIVTIANLVPISTNTSTIVALIETTAIASPIMSASVQTVTSSAKSWSQIVDEDQSKQLVPKTPSRIDESDYVEDTEIEQRIQQESDKLKLYASQIDRLKKQLTIIEHQREIALLNLDILGATLPEAHSESEPKVTKSSVKIEKSSKSSELNRQSLPGPSTSSQVQSDSDTLCFNCSARGHKSLECTQPRREKGSCFKYGSKLHVLQDCPWKKRNSEFRSNENKNDSADSD